jgi:hypothetical protein
MSIQPYDGTGKLLRGSNLLFDVEYHLRRVQSGPRRAQTHFGGYDELGTEKVTIQGRVATTPHQLLGQLVGTLETLTLVMADGGKLDLQVVGYDGNITAVSDIYY